MIEKERDKDFAGGVGRKALSWQPIGRRGIKVLLKPKGGGGGGGGR